MVTRSSAKGRKATAKVVKKQPAKKRSTKKAASAKKSTGRASISPAALKEASKILEKRFSGLIEDVNADARLDAIEKGLTGVENQLRAILEFMDKRFAYLGLPPETSSGALRSRVPDLQTHRSPVDGLARQELTSFKRR